MSRPSNAPRILAPDMIVWRDPSGAMRARSPHPLGPYPATVTTRLEEWAARAPDRTFLAARDGAGEWQRLTYGAAFDRVRAAGEAIVSRRLSVDRPIVILSGNSLEHAVLALAAMHVGVPYAPLAPSYSLVSRDHRTLRAIVSAMRPGLVFAQDPEPFARALDAIASPELEVVGCGPTARERDVTPFDALLSVRPAARGDAAHAAVKPDAIAKVLFTSGSTGEPKGVITTHRMLSANQEQIRTVMGFLADEPPILCDWLPWNHVFGGNHNFGLTLYNGGTLFIDAGAPTPAAFGETRRNLREIAPTAYFNVPRGYEMLLPALREDVEFRRRFFSRLKMLFYAAAGLRQQTADAIEDLAVDTTGERIPWVTGLGSTETAPFAMCTGPMSTPITGHVGGPVPGIELKIAAVDDRLEARVRGPNVTPGYWRDPVATASAFDADGFYCMGDALVPVDPTDMSRGFSFGGRLLEDFKLSTGTWVHVGPLRAALVAHFGDLVQDAAIAGHDRDEIVALVFPNVAVCRQLAGAPSEAPLREVLAAPAVRTRFAGALAAFAAVHLGSSMRVVRVALLDEAPSLDAREITDKGTLNQRAVLRRRAGVVAQLYGETPGPALVVDIQERTAAS